MNDRPPMLGRLIARWLAPRSRRDEIDGDLLEAWRRRRAASQHARRAFWRDVWSVIQIRESSPAAAPALERRSRAQGGRDMWQDIEYALRLMRRQPGFSIVAIATLALGIAASTAVFTVCDRVLMRPLPYPAPHELVLLDRVGFSFSSRGMGVSRAVRELPEFAAVGIYAAGGLNLGASGGASRLRAAAATSGFFNALGVKAFIGHTFDLEDDTNAAKVAVLSFNAWRRLFASDRNLLDRSIQLNGRSFTVIGVMPNGFTFPADADVWIPPASDSQISGGAFAPMQIARLAPGISIAQAVAALTRLDELRLGRPLVASDSPPVATPLQTDLTIGVRPTLTFLTAVVGLLLAITSANIAGLMLSRLRGRERELLVRTALGAHRGRLVRQLLTECATLTATGALVGLIAAFWALRVFRAAMPGFARDIDLTSLDVRFLSVGLLVSIVTMLAFGVGPALSAGRASVSDALRQAALPTRRSRWFGHALVSGQVAVALLLLVATTAALVVVVRFTSVDLGFTNGRAVVFELTLPRSRYERAAAVQDFWQQVSGRLRGVPGFVGAGATNYAPGSIQTGIGLGLVLAGAPDIVPATRPPSASLLSASPAYFKTMGIATLAGRTFTEADHPAARPVVVLSRSAALKLDPDITQVVGAHLTFTRILPADVEIVGVVEDTRLRSVRGASIPQMYQPLAQASPTGSLGVVVDATGDEDAVLAGARQALHDVDPDLPVYNVKRISDVRASFLATERFTLALCGVFATVGLVLSAVGLYGVLSQQVALRRREIGVRMALGANRFHLRWEVVRGGLLVSMAGVVVGAAAAFATSKLATSVMPGFEIPSAPTIAGLAVALLGVSALAAWLPARRASAIDPIQALRE